MKRFLLIFVTISLIAAPELWADEPQPEDWEQASYVERGRYLVNNLAECVGCHTPLGPSGSGDPDMSLFLSGVPAKFAEVKKGPPQVAGFPGPRGARYYPKNLTPDPETGLGEWTEDEFLRAFQKGVQADGSKYGRSPMPWELYRNMREADIRAIYRYLRTIKPIKNRVPADVPPN